MVGYAEFAAPDRGDAAVLPDLPRPRHRHLARRGGCRTSPARHGATVVGMPVPEGSAGDRLLTALGYQVRWTSWVLKLPAGATRRRAPAARRATPCARPSPQEYPAVHTVVEDAFLEWSVRDRETYEDFAAVTVAAPRLRAVAAAGRHRPRRRGRRGRDRDDLRRGRRAPRPSSPGSPPAATSAAAAWPRR